MHIVAREGGNSTVEWLHIGLDQWLMRLPYKGSTQSIHLEVACSCPIHYHFPPLLFHTKCSSQPCLKFVCANISITDNDTD